MNNEIIEKIANRYKVDATELIKHYNTLTTLNEDIRPEPSDMLAYLVLALLNKDQLFYGSLGIQVADFIEKLYFSEEALSTLAISAYDNHGNELHVMEIVDSLFDTENRFANLPTTVWEAHLLRTDLLSSFRNGMIGIFGEDGYRIYNLFSKNSTKLSELQNSINDLIELYEREFNNNEIIEKIAKHYSLIPQVLLQDYMTVSTLHEDIKPEPRDTITYLVLMSLKQEQLLCEKPLGEQLKDFIKKLYSSEKFFNMFRFSAYDSLGNEKHSLDIIYDLCETEDHISNHPINYVQDCVSEELLHFHLEMTDSFGESGRKIYSLIVEYIEDISEYQEQIDNLMQGSAQVISPKGSYIFITIPLSEIKNGNVLSHEEVVKQYGKANFKEITYYDGEYCLVYEKEVE